MVQVFVITALLIFIAILILGVNIFFTKKGKFPETRIGHNKALRKKGIYCPRTLDTLDRKTCQACEYITLMNKSTAEVQCITPSKQ